MDGADREGKGMRRRGVIAALAVGVAALGIATYALAGGSGAGFNHLTATMSGYQEVPAVSSDRLGDVHGRRQQGRQLDRLAAQLHRARRGRPAVAHPLRPAKRERRHLRVPVHEPRQRACRHAALPAVRDDSRNDHGGRRVAADRRDRWSDERRASTRASTTSSCGRSTPARRTRTSTRPRGRAERSAHS